MDEHEEPALRIWRLTPVGKLRLAYSNGMQFWIDDQGRELWALWPDTSSLEDAATYLLGPVLGLLLRLRGTVCLHASAVALDGRAIALIGPPGAGKSTTAAMLTQGGYTLLCDDIVALAEVDGSFQVLPAFPFLCLWPDSAKMLFGCADSLPRFVDSWDKRCFSAVVGGFEFEFNPLALAAVYVLGARTPDAVPFVSPLSAQPALVALLANSYAGKVLGPEMRAQEFSFLCRLIPRAPIRSVRIPEASCATMGALATICHSFLW